MDKQNHSVVTEFVFLALTNATRYPVLLFICFFLLYLVIILINVLLMVVICTNSNLHTPMYFFIFNLSCSDICYTASVVPQTLLNLLSIRHSISFQRCIAQMFCNVAFGAVQIFVITSMAYDRYVAISNPLRYKTVMSWPVCRKLLVIVWLLSTTIAVSMVLSVCLLPFCSPFEIAHFFCDVGQVLRVSCPCIEIHELVEIFTFTPALGIFTIPFLLIVTSYIYIISAIMNIRTNEGRLKAFSTCSSHLTIVFVEYACVGFMYLRPKTTYSLDKERFFVVVFVFGTPILQPIIYSVRNKAVKKGFMKLCYG